MSIYKRDGVTFYFASGVSLYCPLDTLERRYCCLRKPLTEHQARIVAQRRGEKAGIRYYPEYCQICKAYHTCVSQ